MCQLKYVKTVKRIKIVLLVKEEETLPLPKLFIRLTSTRGETSVKGEIATDSAATRVLRNRPIGLFIYEWFV